MVIPASPLYVPTSGWMDISQCIDTNGYMGGWILMNGWVIYSMIGLRFLQINGFIFEFKIK